MKRTVAAVLFAILCGALLFANGSDERKKVETNKDYLANMTAPGTLPVVNEKVTLTALVSPSPNVIDLDTNFATLWAEEMTNVHWEWSVIEGSDSSQKVNLILASGSDIPDVIMNGGLEKLQMYRFGTEGLFLPLEGMIEEYGSVIKENLAYNNAQLTNLTAPDGHLYCIGHYTEGHHDQLSQKLWINTTWLDKVDLDMPGTPDELYRALLAFKEEDPNGNGKADEIPLSSCINNWRSNIEGFIMNAWIYYDGEDGLNMENDRVLASFAQPEFREGLAFLNKLYREELLDPEAFVQDKSILKQLLLGDDMLVGAFPSGTPNVMPNTGEDTKKFAAVPPLTGPKGNSTTGYYPAQAKSGQSFIITSECGQPEVAFRWIDFMQSEEARRVTRYGEESVEWRRANTDEIGINGEQAWVVIEQNIMSMDQQNKAWWHQCPTFQTGAAFLGRAIPPNNPWYIAYRLEQETTNKYEGHQPAQVLPPLFPDDDVAEEYTELKTLINEFVKEHIARFILGTSDIDADWDAYLDELDKMGLDSYLKIIQDTYDRQYGN